MMNSLSLHILQKDRSTGELYTRKDALTTILLEHMDEGHWILGCTRVFIEAPVHMIESTNNKIKLTIHMA